MSLSVNILIFAFQESRCPINGWYDPPMPPRSREVILYLRRHLQRNEAALQECLAGLLPEKLESVNAGDRVIVLEAAHQASLVDLLLEKEKVCSLRNLCVFSWIFIVLVCIWFIQCLQKDTGYLCFGNLSRKQKYCTIVCFVCLGSFNVG